MDLNVLNTRNDFPDGFTLIQGQNGNKIIAIEIEISAKPLARYGKMHLYFHLNKDVEIVFWVCGSLSLAKQILRQMSSARMPYLDPHNFLLIDDFKKLSWGAQVVLGPLTGKKIREIYHANLWQTTGKTAANPWQTETAEILFPFSKSPQKLKPCKPQAIF